MADGGPEGITAAALVGEGDAGYEGLLERFRPEPFAAPGYLRALRRSTGVTPAIASVMGDGWWGGLLLLLQYCEGGAVLARSPDYGGPVIGGGDRNALVMRRAIDDLLRSSGVVSEVLTYSPWVEVSPAIERRWGARVQKEVCVLDISDMAVVRRRSSSGRRSDLSRAARTARWTVDGLSVDAARRFADSYTALMERRGATKRWQLPTEYFEALALDAATECVIADATSAKGGASALFLVSGTRAAYLHSARWGSAPGATTLADWRGFEYLSSLGVNTVNLGGGVGDDDNDPLLQFKRSFGGEARPLFLSARVYDPAAHGRLVARGEARPLPSSVVEVVPPAGRE